MDKSRSSCPLFFFVCVLVSCLAAARLECDAFGLLWMCVQQLRLTLKRQQPQVNESTHTHKQTQCEMDAQIFSIEFNCHNKIPKSFFFLSSFFFFCDSRAHFISFSVKHKQTNDARKKNDNDNDQSDREKMENKIENKSNSILGVPLSSLANRKRIFAITHTFLCHNLYGSLDFTQTHSYTHAHTTLLLYFFFFSLYECLSLLRFLLLLICFNGFWLLRKKKSLDPFFRSYEFILCSCSFPLRFDIIRQPFLFFSLICACVRVLLLLLNAFDCY